MEFVDRWLWEEWPYRSCEEVVRWNAGAGFVLVGFNERNVVAWNAMISGCMKNGDMLCAGKLFDDMTERNLVTWNSVITGFEKLGDFKEALGAYEGLLGEEIVPNVITLVTVLSAVSGLAFLERGRSIHMFINEHGFSLDRVLGVGLIDMCSKGGGIKSALSIFRGIKIKKLGHWTSMIIEFGMHVMTGKAIELFAKMREKGMRPDGVLFIGLLNGCCHAGMVDERRHFFELMSTEYKIEPTVEHYGCLVDLFCRADAWRRRKMSSIACVCGQTP